MKTIIKIIKSRFTKPKTDKEIERKKNICKNCEFNSLNAEKIEFKKKLLKKLSDFYSLIAGKKEEDNLGLCTVCGCSVYYKILMSEDGEDCLKGKWKTN